MPTTLRASIVVAFAPLAAAPPASAHTRAPAVALDVRLRVTAAPAGVHADVLDGDRALRLRVEPPHLVVVRGLLGEPVLRFGPDGVWVNRASPTVASDRIATRGAGWERLRDGTAFTWHDHRLGPPRGLASTAPWSLPLSLDGRPALLRGEFVRAPRPSPWPWLAGAAFATGDAISRVGEWIDVAAAGTLALVALGALSIRSWSVRGWVTTIVGAVAAAISLGSLGVFWHGVVISSLPPELARLATGTAVVCGLSAAVLAVAIGEKR